MLVLIIRCIFTVSVSNIKNKTSRFFGSNLIKYITIHDATKLPSYLCGLLAIHEIGSRRMTKDT